MPASESWLVGNLLNRSGIPGQWTKQTDHFLLRSYFKIVSVIRNYQVPSLGMSHLKNPASAVALPVLKSERFFYLSQKHILFPSANF